MMSDCFCVDNSIMDTKQAYDKWATEYDTTSNSTRDLEAKALRTILQNIQFDKCLEIGCGTGRHTREMNKYFNGVTAIDIDEKMLEKANYLTKIPRMKFILIDRILSFEPGKTLRAVKSVSLAEEYLGDHFPIFPVLPGVLVENPIF